MKIYEKYILVLFFLSKLINAFAIQDPIFFIEDGWFNQTHVGYIGHFKIPIKIEFSSWWSVLIFDVPISYFEVWQGDLLKSNSLKTYWYFKGKRWNNHMYPGSVLDQRFHVEYPRQPNIDYRIFKGQRPLIVFRDKVFKPNPVKNDEFPMEIFNIQEFALPSDLELLPVVEAVTTQAPATLEPLTKGLNSGIFWWVRTRYAKPTRPSDKQQTTALVTAEPVTKANKKKRNCKRIKNLLSNKCKKTKTNPNHCYVPECNSVKNERFISIQCWKYQGACWCVDEDDGKRTSGIARYRLRGSLPCLKDTEKPLEVTALPATTVSVMETLTKPSFVPKMTHDYNLVLRYSLLYFEAQRSGNLRDNNRISWRKSAHLYDGKPYGYDLSGGYYVSGDYVKYNFPIAAAMTTLAWGFLEFPDAYKDSNQTEYLKDALKWGADYFIKCHVSKYKLFGQVGDASIENSFWKRPQDMKVRRPCYAVGVKNPGSDLAAEIAAALSATAKVWMLCGASKNDAYVKKLINHAKDLLDFSIKYKQIYSISIRQAKNHYSSSGYEDEIVWAHLWLFQATNQRNFLSSAGRLFDEYKFHTTQYESSWDNKIAAVQLLLSQLSPNLYSESYLSPVKKFCDYNMPDNEYGAPYTTEGLVYINKWSPSRYASNAAFICLITSKSPTLDQNLKKTYRKFAEDQIDYLLGKMGRSFMIGYGSEYPQTPHHRASSCPRTGLCGWENGFNNPDPNPYLLIGALVSGPNINDHWENDRSNFTTNAVSLNNNAGFQGAVAGLRHFQLEYNKWRNWNMKQ